MSQPASTSFRIMTFNTKGQDRFGGAERAEMCGRTIQFAKPHIVGFQEFGISRWDTLGPMLPEYEIYRGEPAGDILINPLAWKRDRFVWLCGGTIWLSETPHKFSKGWDGQERGMTWARLIDLEAEAEFIVMNIHLDNIGRIARIEGTKQVFRFVDSYPHNDSMILTGDFNCGTYNPLTHKYQMAEPYQFLNKTGFIDVWGVRWASVFPPPHTFHNHEGESYACNPDRYGTWDTDHIFVRGFEVLEAEIVRYNENGYYPSDHYPVKATVDYVFMSL